MLRVNAGIYVRRRRPSAAVLLVGLLILLIAGWGAALVELAYPTAYLEGLMLVASLTAYAGGMANRSLTKFAFAIVIYIVACGILAVFHRGVNAMDFMQAFKAPWYLLLVLPFTKKELFEARDVRNLSNLCLVVFASAYAIKRLLLGIDRPFLVVENNFELIFLLLMFYAAYLSSKRVSPTSIVLLGLTVALSGSRSSALAVVVVLAFCVDYKRMRSRDWVVVGAILAGFVIAFLTFNSRSTGSIDEIDRYKFLQYFLYATRNWSFLDFLLGADRLTALPAETCVSLASYERLFSFSGDGSCYAVALHSFNMRVIFDHGLIVFALMLYCVWLVLGRLDYWARTCVVLVILVTGMSVSALNNVYVAIPLAFLASLKFPAEDQRTSVTRQARRKSSVGV